MNVQQWIAKRLGSDGTESRSFDRSLLRTGTIIQKIGAFEADLFSKDGDPRNVRRLLIRWGNAKNRGFALELLPSKGLSVGDFTTPRGNLFWKIPVENIVDPERFDLLGPMLVNGEKTESLRWIENFAGAIELLGLSNWGMPWKPEGSAHVLPLHGEASQIPVDTLTVRGGDTVLVATAAFAINDRWWSDETPESASKPWYSRGVSQWRVVRHVILDVEAFSVEVVDEITNIGADPRVPDWGYHIQLRVEDGARMVIPGVSHHSRFGETVEDDFDAWRPSPIPEHRDERGYIHRGCPVTLNPLGQESVEGRAIYPGSPDTLFTIPRSPYVLSWFSCGGAGGNEFDRPERPDGSYMKIGWDGMGPEFGASALDHDGNVDPDVIEASLEPGETRTLYLMVRQDLQ